MFFWSVQGFLSLFAEKLRQGWRAADSCPFACSADGPCENDAVLCIEVQSESALLAAHLLPLLPKVVARMGFMWLVISLLDTCAFHKGLEGAFIDSFCVHRSHICRTEGSPWFLPACAALGVLVPAVVALLCFNSELLAWLVEALFNDRHSKCLMDSCCAKSTLEATAMRHPSVLWGGPRPLRWS